MDKISYIIIVTILGEDRMGYDKEYYKFDFVDMYGDFTEETDKIAVEEAKRKYSSGKIEVYRLGSENLIK